MKKTLTFCMVMAFAMLSFAQLTTEWEMTSANSSMPSWFGTGHTERGFGYNPVTEHLLVASRNGGTFVYVMDATNGADAGTLDVTGVTGGTYSIDDVGCTDDGKIYAGNLVINEAAFKLYYWADESATPTVAFESTLGDQDKRVGDNFTVVGSASDNSAKIFLPAGKIDKIYILETSDNGVTFTLADSVSLPAGTFGGAPSVFPIMDPGTGTIFGYLVNGTGKNAQFFNTSGVLEGTIPGGQLGSGSTTTGLFYLNDDFDQAYVASFDYVTATCRILDTHQDPEYFKTYAVSPTLGSNGNSNGTGDLQYRYNTDGTVTVFVLGTNNGVAAYTIDNPFIVNGRFHEDYVQIAEKQNTNNGFGDDINVMRVAYETDGTDLYLAISGYLNTGSGDGIAVLFNVNSVTGAPAGTMLGGITNGGHLFGAASNPNWAMDFEVDFAFAFNPGSSDTAVYLDAATYVGTPEGQYIGYVNPNGAASQGPDADGIFTANSITFAFDSAQTTVRGMEIKIPLNEIGDPTLRDALMNPEELSSIQAFAVVVSNTAYFSDVTVPGTITGGNPGFDVDFGTLTGGPFHGGTMQPTYPELTIAQAREDLDNDYVPDRLGDTVVVTGVVNSPNYNTGNFNYVIHDGTAGITTIGFGYAGPEYSLGDSLEVVGEIGQYNGLTQIEPIDGGVTLLGSGAQTLGFNIMSIAHYLANAEDYEGEVVAFIALNKVAGETWPSSGSNANILFTDGADTITIRVDKETDIDENPEPTWPQDILGFGSQFSSNTPPNDGYQILPRSIGDFLPPYTVPVELTSFSATVNEGGVILNWTTATEQNNLQFEVERSVDNVTFATIGTVQGQGTTTEPAAYTFTDSNVKEGEYIYRLRQIDFDGSYNYSKTITVNVENTIPREFALQQNYPNPFNPATVIRFTVAIEQMASLRVYNALGEEVMTLFNGIAKPGQLYEINFDAQQLTSGVYFYQLKQGDKISSKKMMLLK